MLLHFCLTVTFYFPCTSAPPVLSISLTRLQRLSTTAPTPLAASPSHSPCPPYDIIPAGQYTIHPLVHHQPILSTFHIAHSPCPPYDILPAGQYSTHTNLFHNDFICPPYFASSIYSTLATISYLPSLRVIHIDHTNHAVLTMPPQQHPYYYNDPLAAVRNPQVRMTRHKDKG